MAGPALTTSPAGYALLPHLWDNMLASNLYPALYLWQFGSPRSVPKGQGNSIRIPRIKKMTASLTTPTEGVPIGTCPMSANFVSGTLAQLAYAYSHSDVFVMTSLSDVIELSVREIGRQMARGIDAKIRQTISDGAATTTDGAVMGAATSWGCVKTTTKLRATDLLRAVTKLEKNDNPRPANGFFPVIIHPAQQYDIMYNAALSGAANAGQWIDAHKYSDSAAAGHIYRGEIGRIFGAAVVTSSQCKRVAGTAGDGGNVGISRLNSGYLGFAFAPEPYFVTEINGNTAQVIVKPLGSGGTYDPANQLATVAAKAYFACIKNFVADVRYIRIVAGYDTTL